MTQPVTHENSAQRAITNNIPLKLANACYVTLIDAIPGYHNLKLSKIIMLYYICMSVWQVQIH